MDHLSDAELLLRGILVGAAVWKPVAHDPFRRGNLHIGHRWKKFGINLTEDNLPKLPKRIRGELAEEIQKALG